MWLDNISFPGSQGANVNIQANSVWVPSVMHLTTHASWCNWKSIDQMMNTWPYENVTLWVRTIWCGSYKKMYYSSTKQWQLWFHLHCFQHPSNADALGLLVRLVAIPKVSVPMSRWARYRAPVCLHWRVCAYERLTLLISRWHRAWQPVPPVYVVCVWMDECWLVL